MNARSPQARFGVLHRSAEPGGSIAAALWIGTTSSAFSRSTVPRSQAQCSRSRIPLSEEGVVTADSDPQRPPRLDVAKDDIGVFSYRLNGHLAGSRPGGRRRTPGLPPFPRG